MSIAPRLAIVLSHPTQYYSPWFRWLAQHTELTLRVFYLSDVGLTETRDEKFEQKFAWDVDLTSGYEWEVVPNRARKPDVLRFSGLHNPELIPRLRDWNPTAILLFGYNYRTHFRLILWARSARLPLIFRGDSHLIGRARLSWLKRLALRALYSQFAAVTYVGAANRDYFRACGVRAQRLFFAPHAVDAERFDPARPDLISARENQRRELGLASDARVVLFAGKLISQKQPRPLLEAFLRIQTPNTALVFVGDGPEKSALQSLAAEHPEAAVRFLPFTNQADMPSRYLLADLFALPSRGEYETWGLAVNEAMQLGLPCLVSDRVGCQRDLIRDGQTGWVFDAEQPAALEEALRGALTLDKARFDARARAARELVARYSYAAAADGLLAALASLASQ